MVFLDHRKQRHLRVSQARKIDIQPVADRAVFQVLQIDDVWDDGLRGAVADPVVIGVLQERAVEGRGDTHCAT